MPDSADAQPDDPRSLQRSKDARLSSIKGEDEIKHRKLPTHKQRRRNSTSLSQFMITTTTTPTRSTIDASDEVAPRSRGGTLPHQPPHQTTAPTRSVPFVYSLYGLALSALPLPLWSSALTPTSSP